MPEENKQNRIKWEVAEFKKPERPRNWYIATGVIGFLMIFFSFFAFRLHPFRLIFLGSSNNFLFALIIILAIAIMFILESREAKMVKVKLDGEGLTLGQKFYDYDEFKNFCVLYKPKESLKNLYIEFKNSAKFRISLPLRSLDPLLVRNFLKRYLEEDLERTGPPVSEQLTKLLKL
jgi:hypothetical protein